MGVQFHHNRAERGIVLFCLQGPSWEKVYGIILHICSYNLDIYMTILFEMFLNKKFKTIYSRFEYLKLLLSVCPVPVRPPVLIVILLMIGTFRKYELFKYYNWLFLLLFLLLGKGNVC